MRRPVLWAGLFALSLLGSGAAQAQMRPAFDSVLSGPTDAKGAVIYNHGRGHKNASDKPAPFVDWFRQDGWDVYTLYRPLSEDKNTASAHKLIAEAQGLKAKGYKRIIAVGQSAGAWISFIAGGLQPDLFYALVATAPAANGRRGENPNWQRNSQFVDLAAKIHPTRAAVFYFENDDFDPGGRGHATERALKHLGLPHLVVDRPTGFSGHGAAGSKEFAWKFGPCIIAFVNDAAAKDLYRCPDHAWDTVKAGFPLPDDVLLPASRRAEAGSGASRMVGAWYGRYARNGRDTLLVVENADAPDAVRGLYAWGEVKDGKSGFERVEGRYDPATATLSFADERRTLTYRLRADGRVDLTWQRNASGEPLKAVLDRLE